MSVKYSACIYSIMRTYYSAIGVNHHDSTFNYVQVLLWTFVLPNSSSIVSPKSIVASSAAASPFSQPSFDTSTHNSVPVAKAQNPKTAATLSQTSIVVVVWVRGLWTRMIWSWTKLA